MKIGEPRSGETMLRDHGKVAEVRVRKRLRKVDQGKKKAAYGNFQSDLPNRRRAYEDGGFRSFQEIQNLLRKPLGCLKRPDQRVRIEQKL